jgi:hypothetical protein
VVGLSLRWGSLVSGGALSSLVGLSLRWGSLVSGGALSSKSGGLRDDGRN